MTRYEITITEHVVETKTVGKEWERGADKVDEDHPSGWGYTPEIEKKVAVKREIFSQTTEDLNLVAVIKAVNGI